jgi:small subunit ribosomal protein S1
MVNEVIDETEGSNETPGIEETNREVAAETAADETATEAPAGEVAAEIETAEAPAEEAAAETETAEAPAEEAAAETETAEAPVEETPVETNAAETPVLKAEEAESGDEPHGTGDVDFGAILEKFEQDQTIYHSGELVSGKVVGVSDRGVLIDFGYKSEGAVPLEEFTSPEGDITVKQGDMVEVVIRNIHSGDGPPMLSRYDALRRKTWDEIETAYNKEMPVKGFVIDKTKGGLRVDINGIEAFLPGSQIDSRPFSNLDSYIGKEIEAKVIKFSRRRNNLVLSRKVLTDEIVNKQKAETLKNIEEGFVIEGVVKNLTQYGAFIDIGGLDGLLHVSDMFWERTPVQHDPFKVGESVQVKVLKLDREKEKVALGYKQLVPDPWQIVPEIYPVGSKVTGKVSSTTDYGVFIELESGIEGLVHVSEMSWSKRSVMPRKVVRPGQEIEVQILGIDTEDHRISLGMKQLMPNPWQTVGERFHVGDRIRGKIRNITDFGAFVEIEEGIDGLVHVSDITWSKKIRHPKDLLEKDQEVDAIITSIDPAGQRMSLSMKDITPSEWESFIATHKTGDIVRGKITRFAGFGVFAELGNELEGLCHISELADERVERPEDVVQIGQEMDFKILRIDHEDRKIGLSARAAIGSADRDSGDSRSYSTEAKGGMASLGELMKLKRGNAPEEETKEEPKLSKKERKALKAQEKAAAAEAAENETAAETSETAETEAAPVETSETADETPAAETTETVDAEAPAETEAAPVETAETADETPAAETTETVDEEAPAETEAAPVETAETADETPAAETTETVDAEAPAETEAAPVETSETADETPAAETTETVDEEAPAETEAAPLETAETADETPAAETTETVGAEAPAETAAEEKAETEPETAAEEKVETEAETEKEADAETTDAPQLTDIEGEAESAPDDTTPRDEIAEEEAKGENESSETSDETEEKTAGN